MSFAEAVIDQSLETRTTNGMKALSSTTNANVDLFFKIGASRGKDVSAAFEAAYQNDRIAALRTIFWARDVREGAGERQLFRNLLNYIELYHPADLEMVIANVAEFGRWDDLLVFQTPEARRIAFEAIRFALRADRNGLCAKWMPRKGPIAHALRKHLDLSPKAYRKLLVGLTQVVETQMCAKDWSSINYSHVPSQAAARYQRAFTKQDGERYQAYRAELAKPKEQRDPSVKINANAIYPYEIIHNLRNKGAAFEDLAVAQWDALPNYVGDASILPVVDVSGSMGWVKCPGSSVTPMDVAISIGLYLADKNKGVFKDLVSTFSDRPTLEVMKGNLIKKLEKIEAMDVGGTTNLHALFDRVLDVAVKHKVSQADMPKLVLIMSDMQFNACMRFDDSAMEMIKRKYTAAGYETPGIVFWNIADNGNVPVKHNEKGVALVSGFSPSIVKNVLKGDELTPVAIMNQTINSPRYQVIA